MATVELPMEDALQLIKTQRAVMEQQLRIIDDMSRAPSEASIRVRGDGIDQLAEGYQRLTLDQQQETEKFVLHRGKFMK